MLPVIAIVGRPNVGKSTLFNRLTKSWDALVADMPGVTRDRKYGEGQCSEHSFIVVDTGGITGDEQGIDYKMAEQSLLAIEEADVVLFMVDGRYGLNPGDQQIANYLRKNKKNVHLVVNKTDGIDPDIAVSDFHSLGMGEPLAIAASQNRGVTLLIEYVLNPFPGSIQDEDRHVGQGVRIAVVGRPNVGKSTLVNRLLGEERVIVFDEAGTTRDSIYIPYERDGQNYTLIDTAGVRRRKNVREAVEKFSIIKTLQAINDANVVGLVIDARQGVTDQDLHMLGFVMSTGRSLVVTLNKWDGMAKDSRADVKEQIQRKLDFASFARFHFISALHGTGVGEMYESIDEAYQCAMMKWSTNYLTTLLADIVSDHQPPSPAGRRIKLRYAHQGGSNPPVIVVHGNQTDQLPLSYKKYLQNKFTKHLKVFGTPIRFEFRTGINPFAEDRNDSTGVKLDKRERFQKQVRKLKKTATKKKSVRR
jgi:GTP-binding protein